MGDRWTTAHTNTANSPVEPKFTALPSVIGPSCSSLNSDTQWEGGITSGWQCGEGWARLLFFDQTADWMSCEIHPPLMETDYCYMVTGHFVAVYLSVTFSSSVVCGCLGQAAFKPQFTRLLFKSFLVFLPTCLSEWISINVRTTALFH